MKLAMAPFLVITSFAILFLSIFLNSSGESEPNVIISPMCGELKGYAMILEVNGFEPNGNVHWQLIDPENKTISSYGYFATNNTGGFNEDSFVEGPLIKGSYEIQLFDDSDNDSLPDSNTIIKKLTIRVPCQTYNIFEILTLIIENFYKVQT